MKIFEFIRRQMMPLVVLCCFVCLGILFAAGCTHEPATLEDSLAEVEN